MGDVFAVRSLGDVCVLITDGSHFSPIPRQEGYPIVNAKDMRGGRLDLDSCTRISEKDWKLLCAQNCAPRTGDVLLSKDGTIGRVVFYGDDSGVVLLSSVAIIRPDEATNARYLAQALRSHYFDSQLFKLQSGSALKRLVLSDIRRINLPFPDEARQRKIAAILDTIDQTIEKTEALIEKCQQIKAGLMHDLFTRGIGADGKLRPPREQAPELYQQTSIGWIPKEWEFSTCSDVCEKVIDCKNRTPPITSDGYPVIRTPNVRNGIFVDHELVFTDRHSYEVWTARGIPVPGDIVITREAPVGEVCKIPERHAKACLGQRMMLYRVDSSKILNDYFLYVLQSRAIQNRLDLISGGSTVGHVRVGDVRNLWVFYPRRESEQQKIAGSLNAISRKIETENNRLNKFKMKKQGLLHDLLTGQVQVNVEQPEAALV